MAWTQQHDAGARDAQVAPCNNLRHMYTRLLDEDTSSCLAPGLFRVADALLITTQVGPCLARVECRYHTRLLGAMLLIPLSVVLSWAYVHVLQWPVQVAVMQT